MKTTICSIFLATFFFLFYVHSEAQTAIPISGDFLCIKNEKNLNVSFSYDSLKIGLFPNEDTYIKKRVEEYETKKPGKGKEWEEEWEEIKKNAETYFIKDFNKKISGKLGITMSRNYPGTNYTFLLVPKFLEIGWSGGIVGSSGTLEMDVVLYRSDDLSKPVGIMKTGSIAQNETVRKRIEALYRLTAQGLAKFLIKNVYSKAK